MNYFDYAKSRDEHVYKMWKQGKTKGWIARYIGRSNERARQSVKKFEERARTEGYNTKKMNSNHKVAGRLVLRAPHLHFGSEKPHTGH